MGTCGGAARYQSGCSPDPDGVWREGAGEIEGSGVAGGSIFEAEPSAKAWGTALLYALVCLFFSPPLKNLFFIVVKYT